jgi:putative glutamate/gamma-aminobutyrate antiporter
MQFAKGKALSVFTLMMINVIAVDSLRTLPISAEYGTALIFYYVIAGLLFFIPTILVTAELATGWPTTGGVYVWVSEAFGKKWGFLTIWLQWIYNVVWYPTILTFLAGTLATLIDPSLSNNKIYTLGVILILFWCATWLNCLGIKISGWVSVAGALVGTLIPMALIIGLGILWIIQGNPSQLHFDKASLLPHLNNLNNLGFLTAVLFGLMGMEMSAVHAGDVRDPQRDYPRALKYSAIIILLTLVGGSLAIAIVIPNQQINLVSSLVEAYALFFKAHHLSWMIPLVVGLIVLSSLAGVSTWVIGPTRGLWVAAEQGNMPSYFAKLNTKGAPTRILILQGVIATLLCGVFLLMPSVNTSYWILSVLTSQLALLFYLFMFAAAIRLRIRNVAKPRTYRIPGGNMGMWLIAGVGFITTFGTIILGFMPPADLHITSVKTYEMILVGGMILLSVPPLFISMRKTIK